ncbi:MAG: glycosyltransferase family 2 protein [Clostridiales Family XIII bacterium]|nr:glycosyltransferase family 2 protein [Clostridiales Family XIII bacterium]
MMNNNEQYVGIGMTTKKVLIVILNYITYDLTLRLLEDLKKLMLSNAAVMVVDNCSPNDSAKVLEEGSETGGYIFFSNQNNTGYAAGNNIGIKYAVEHGFEYTLILNNDVKLCDENVLMIMMKTMESSSDIGCVGPKILNLEGTVCYPYIDRPTLWSMTLGIISGKAKRKTAVDVSQYVYRVHGCCMLLRNSIMQRIDYMDERTFLYCEENILAERMLKVNSLSYYCADTSIIHIGSSTTQKTYGAKRRRAIQVTRDSMEIYLRDYRGYNRGSRFICESMRSLIIAIRG